MMDPKVVRRALRVVHCLEERTQELIGASQVVIDGNEYHSSFMSNTLIKLQAMKQMLNSPAEDWLIFGQICLVSGLIVYVFDWCLGYSYFVLRVHFTRVMTLVRVLLHVLHILLYSYALLRHSTCGQMFTIKTTSFHTRTSTRIHLAHNNYLEAMDQHMRTPHVDNTVYRFYHDMNDILHFTRCMSCAWSINKTMSSMGFRSDVWRYKIAAAFLSACLYLHCRANANLVSSLD